LASSPTHPDAQAVLVFWFEELEPRQWWIKDPELDREIRHRFGDTLEQARRAELGHWRQDARGRLAEIIVLDQFSRNGYRGSPDAFSADPLALGLAQEAVALGLDQQLPPQQRSFLYMPYMHSESSHTHRLAVSLFESLGMPRSLDSELRHKAIIDRFGRYPHRNVVLGRESTADERVFLLEPGSSF
jgi:uncharacterized protein (DUF924 family)